MKRKSIAEIGDGLDDLDAVLSPEAKKSEAPNHPTTRIGMLGSRDKARREIVFLVDPENCAPWAFHNRKANSWWNYHSCQDVIESIRNRGQDTPVWARKRPASEGGITWEIIAGRRRWYACKFLKQELKVKEFEGSDREAAILMNSENMDRDDITEFEYALSFKEQIEQDLFTSQDDMLLALTSRDEGHLKLNKSKLSKMLKAAELYKHPTLEKLFPDAASLKVNPVYGLMVEIDTHRKEILAKANDLVQKFSDKEDHPKPTEIIKRLLSVVVKDTQKPKSRVYKTSNNKKLFEATMRKQGLTVELDRYALSSKSRSEVIQQITKMLSEFQLDG